MLLRLLVVAIVLLSPLPALACQCSIGSQQIELQAALVFEADVASQAAGPPGGESLTLTGVRVVRGTPMGASELTLTNGDDCSPVPVVAGKRYRFSLMRANDSHINVCRAAAFELGDIAPRAPSLTDEPTPASAPPSRDVSTPAGVPAGTAPPASDSGCAGCSVPPSAGASPLAGLALLLLAGGLARARSRRPERFQSRR